MQVSVYPFPSAYRERSYAGKIVVVVDVLRATTTILEALQNGARQVIPVREASEASKLLSNFGRSETLLAGESGGMKLSGYDLGNSPFEFTRSRVLDKTILMNTTNGTDALLEARNARLVLIGCMRNRTAVARAALAGGGDILLLNAGTMGECSADDLICAGGILQEIRRLAGTELEQNDFAAISATMYQAWKAGRLNLDISGHYRFLQSLGFEEDLRYCFEEDQTELVPVYRDGTVRP